jgi:hypothetical protein
MRNSHASDENSSFVDITLATYSFHRSRHDERPLRYTRTPLTSIVKRSFTSRRRRKMAADIPVLGASFTILVMVAFLASPGIGVVVDWFARHRQQGGNAR